MQSKAGKGFEGRASGDELTHRACKHENTKKIVLQFSRDSYNNLCRTEVVMGMLEGFLDDVKDVVNLE